MEGQETLQAHTFPDVHPSQHSDGETLQGLVYEKCGNQGFLRLLQ